MAATNEQQAAALELRNDDIILKKPSFVVGKRLVEEARWEVGRVLGVTNCNAG